MKPLRRRDLFLDGIKQMLRSKLVRIFLKKEIKMTLNLSEIKWSHYGQTKFLTSSGLRDKKIIILVLTDSGNLNFCTFYSCVDNWIYTHQCIAVMTEHTSSLRNDLRKEMFRWTSDSHHLAPTWELRRQH